MRWGSGGTSDTVCVLFQLARGAAGVPSKVENVIIAGYYLLGRLDQSFFENFAPGNSDTDSTGTNPSNPACPSHTARIGV